MPSTCNGEIDMAFDLWDVGTNQFLGHYEHEADALILVRTLVSNFGSAYADDLELGGSTVDGEALESFSGAALIARADDVLSSRHDEQEGVIVGSRVADRDGKSNNRG